MLPCSKVEQPRARHHPRETHGERRLAELIVARTAPRSTGGVTSEAAMRLRLRLQPVGRAAVVLLSCISHRGCLDHAVCYRCRQSLVHCTRFACR